MNTDFNGGDAGIQGKKDVLVSDVKAVVSDADALVKQVIDSTASEISAARTKIETRLSDARAGLDRAAHAVSDKVSRAADNTRVYVSENPWKAIGVAAAAGLLVALLMRRR
ncbi:hypothetical protein BSY238_365 [Methyloversatilis sp. RAC08]|uniref:DUF883 family protein n=1 Tax=Methyloversatilis sp. RAC08 TaxID=1842540 RepID=UPI00083D94F7|nr:DUF883 family protein [Methyloversatilis sp. RAC08]AOF83332.1 hypothetical protein BSY238_365 [Methyloversatilis sp. RAC08]